MFTDASCFHAAFGTLLLDLSPGFDPASVLGCWAGTCAVLTNEGIRFAPVLPGLVHTLRTAGHNVRHTYARVGGVDDLAATLALTGSAVAVLDTYYLDHFWVDQGRTHALHSVVLRDFDSDVGSLRLTDPGDVVAFDGRVLLETLRPALAREDMGQSWMVIGSRADHNPVPHPPWAAMKEELVGRGGRALSGLELTESLCEGLVTLFSGDTRAGHGAWSDVPTLQHGLWAYHHTLRWFGRFLGIFEHNVSPNATLINGAAQDLLVVRALLRHAGVEEQDRMVRHRTEVTRRLERIARSLETVAAELPSGAGQTRQESSMQGEIRA